MPLFYNKPSQYDVSKFSFSSALGAGKVKYRYFVYLHNTTPGRACSTKLRLEGSVRFSSSSSSFPTRSAGAIFVKFQKPPQSSGEVRVVHNVALARPVFLHQESD